MLDEAQQAPSIDTWLESKLAAGERLMGFGHRVFRVRDPRAVALRDAVYRLTPLPARLAFAQDFERQALAALHRHKPGRRVETNVEFYTAVLLDALGLPRDAFTPVFGIARSAGWLAHSMEQQRKGRLIRPSSAYVGPPLATQTALNGI